MTAAELSPPLETTTLTTPLGAIRGLLRGNVHVFKGIRFATAERFGRPVPVGPWHGELDATRFGAQAPQTAGLIERTLGAGSLPMDEDCLFLNIVRPASPGSDRPVLVWIHGGGFATGSAAVPWYDGTHLAGSGDTVVVTINYRLGALGFSGRSNLGVHDQLCALRWVQDNIAAFGGDPSNVTIFGESAGGASVVALMGTDASDGLFHSAMAMSPSVTQLRTAERADEALAEFLRAAGATALDELLDASIDSILHAQTASLSQGGAGLTNFSPSIDGDLFTDDIAAAAARSAVPLVIGTTRDEARLFNAFNPRLADPSDEQIDRLAADAFGEHRHEAIALYRSHLSDPTAFELYNAIHTDAVFRAPAWRLAAARHDADMPTWMYWFTWATPAFDGRLGSCHALDVPFAFHTLHRNGVEMMTGDDPQRFEVADTFSRVVIDLAHHGRVSWEPYSLPDRPTRRIDVHSVTLSAPDAALHQLWLSR